MLCHYGPRLLLGLPLDHQLDAVARPVASHGVDLAGLADGADQGAVEMGLLWAPRLSHAPAARMWSVVHLPSNRNTCVDNSWLRPKPQRAPRVASNQIDGAALDSDLGFNSAARGKIRLATKPGVVAQRWQLEQPPLGQRNRVGQRLNWASPR